MQISNRIVKVAILFVAISISSTILDAQTALSIEKIMQGTDFVGQSPSNISWSADSESVRFRWNPERADLESSYRFSKDLKPEKMSLEEEKHWVGNYAFNKSNSKIVYSQNGDLFISDPDGSNLLRITNTLGIERSPVFVENDTKVLYETGDNFFTWDIKTGSTTQLTNFVKGDKRKERPEKPNDEWIEDDQMELMEVLKERKRISELRKERRDQSKEDRPDPIYLGKQRLISKTLSPDMKYVTYTLMKSPDSKPTKVPHFVAEDAYLDIRNGRSKVGSPQSTYTFFIYDLAVDTTYKLDLSKVEGIKDKPAFLEAYHEEGEYDNQYKKKRKVIVHGPIYNEMNNAAIVVLRSMDNKDRWIMSLDLSSGETDLLDRQRDEAWIGGPGIGGWNFSQGNIEWIDENRFYFQSEESGYSHLYIYDFQQKKKKQITTGNWEIRNAWLNAKKDGFYFISNEVEPGQQHFYQMDIDGKNKKKLTQKEGSYQIYMSPDEESVVALYSNQNTPWELYTLDFKNETETRITNSTTSEFNGYPWRAPGVITFEARDGAKVHARLYKNEKTAKGGPAVIFVHGAGYLQNAHKWWSSYYREYMFHNYLVDQGYTVLDIDYRASDGYGRDWRTAIYQHMGGWDLNDQIDGAKFLVEEHGIDKDRIGIYGGSYGGFITLMALFNSPGTFQCGAALRSVTDWAHYNHGYTSNILNTPVEDPESYRKSSPIYFAENLTDQLLILHGMVDSNVQFQDVVRLAQRLVELGKDNWEFAVFPIEGHGFVESSSWTDEYKRIFKLFEENLK